MFTVSFIWKKLAEDSSLKDDKKARIVSNNDKAQKLAFNVTNLDISIKVTVMQYLMFTALPVLTRKCDGWQWKIESTESFVREETFR